MGVLLVPLGALLVLAAFTDAVVTTLAAGRGGGPLTSRIDRWVLTLLRAVGASRSTAVRPYAGMLVLLATVLLWVALLWTGWTLVFSSSDGAVVSSDDGSPASVAGRVYYAGFVVFTLGVGDLAPGGGAWQVLTALATFLGLFLITLSITYLVSVVSAAVSRRALARTVSVSGSTGVDIVRLHRSGDGLSEHFDSLTTSLCSQVLSTTQQHLAYPVLHSFLTPSAGRRRPAAWPRWTTRCCWPAPGLPQDARPPALVRTRLRLLRALRRDRRRDRERCSGRAAPAVGGGAARRGAARGRGGGVRRCCGAAPGAAARAGAAGAAERPQLAGVTRRDVFGWRQRG